MGTLVVPDKLTRLGQGPGSPSADGWFRAEEKPAFWVLHIPSGQLKSKYINDLNLHALLPWIPAGGHEELGSSDPVVAVRRENVLGKFQLRLGDHYHLKIL